MSQGEFERQYKPPMESTPDEKSPSVSEEALRNIVDDTIKRQDRDGAQADLEALRDVARRYRGRPLELHPVAVDLVDSILRLRFEQGAVDQGAQQGMAEQIATTLVESPGTFDRLEEFWDLLCESTP